MGDGKAISLVDFLDNLVKKGNATPGAISPIKIAFVKVLSTVDGESWENTDVQTIDLDDYMARFTNLTMGTYSHTSLVAYKTRTSKAIKWYLEFLEKPGSVPNIQKRNRQVSSAKPKDVSKKTNHLQPANQEGAAGQQHQAPERTANHVLITYPFPLSDGNLAQLSLPTQLKKVDADRLAVFLSSLTIAHEEGKE